jgi:RHS repeat-associated protein
MRSHLPLVGLAHAMFPLAEPVENHDKTKEQAPDKPPKECMGQPVSLTTGAMFLTHTDAVVGDLVFSRTFHSLRMGLTHQGQPSFGAFGPGWNASVEKRLASAGPRFTAARNEDGNPQYYFDSGGSGVLRSVVPSSVDSWITTTSCPGGQPPGYHGGVCWKRSFRRGGSETYWAEIDWSRAYILSATDPSGNVTTYVYDSAKRLVSVNRLGRSLVLTYPESSTQPHQLQDGNGTILATYGYTGASLSSVTYADGSGYEYHPDGSSPARIAAVTDHAGKKIEAHEYYPDGRAMTSEIGDGVEKLTFVWGEPQPAEADLGDGATELFTTMENMVTDARDNVTKYVVSTRGGLGRVTDATGPCACGGGQTATGSWKYDGAGNILSYTDGTEHTWTYTYDPATGDMLTETTPEPESAQTVYTYWPDGRVQTRTRPDTGVTSYTYDPPGPHTITEAITPTKSRTTTLEYFANGTPKQITDPRNKITKLGYDTTYPADMATITNPLQKVWTIGHDDLGRVTSFKDPLQHETKWVYGDGVHVTRIIRPDLKETKFTYDLGGRRKTVTDALARVTEYGYDDYGRLETVTTRRSVAEPPNSVTTYGYDAMSNLKTIKDARARITKFEYDDYNRVKQVTYPGPETRIEFFTYDGAGHLKTRTDRKGVVTTYDYDNTGRLKGKTYSNGSPAVSYTYDSVGRLKTGTNSADSLTWTYDLAGQLSTEASTANNSTLTYTYDLAGNRQGVLINNALYTWSDYDDAGRLLYTASQASPSQPWKVFYFGYDDANRRSAVLYPNLAATLYFPDELSQLGLIYHYNTLTSAPLTYAGYTYDDVGNREVKALPGYSETYTYSDPMYRLDTVSRSGVLTEDYDYDEVGNRTSAIADPVWSYNDRNEVQSHAGATFGSDPNGNQSSRTDVSGNWVFDWTVENELKRVTKNGAEVARYTYDAVGRRVSRTVGPNVYGYLYDGPDILQSSVGSAVSRFVQGPGIDEHLAAEIPGGPSYYYHADGLGSTVLLTDANRAPVFTYGYDSFGQVQAGSTVSGYAFTGREWDAETGLHYYRARYYDPKIGRFISEDPIGFDGGDINLYAYVGNRPVLFIDPLGLYSFDEFLYDSAQFSAGMGDNLSFGLTGYIRDAMGTSVFIDKCSGIYAAGEWSGVGVSIALGAAAGAKAAGSKMAGREFSHWVPNRMGGPRSIVNGNYVSAARHFYHDPFRFPPGWQALGDKWPAILQQLDRIPNLFKGTAAGAGYGGTSMASNGCECR